MIIVFILGYVLIGILIQLVIRILMKENTLRLGYKAVDDVMFKGVDDIGELKEDIKSGLDEHDENEFMTLMYDPKYVIINILGWPVNIGLCIVYLIRIMKILK